MSESMRKVHGQASGLRALQNEEANAYQAMLLALGYSHPMKALQDLICAWRTSRARLAEAEREIVARAHEAVSSSLRILRPSSNANAEHTETLANCIEDDSQDSAPLISSNLSQSQWVIYFSLEFQKVAPSISKRKALKFARRFYAEGQRPEHVAIALAIDLGLLQAQ